MGLEWVCFVGGCLRVISSACFLRMQEFELRTVCYPFPAVQGDKEAKSVGRRQGNEARPFFLTVR